MPDQVKGRKYLTTTEAARLLSVSPDTVLKWVKAGKVKSRRTLGGHFRIPVSELSPFASDVPIAAPDKRPTAPALTHQYCWEYLAGGKQIKAECMDCITYRSRASRCYELKDLPGGLGCLNLFCDTECSDCDYYKAVSGQDTNVLVLRCSGILITDLATPGKVDDLDVRFASGEYEAATAIQEFRPDYVVVDCSFGMRRTAAICNSLFSDIRIPVARLILSSRVRRIKDYCDQEIFGWIKKPFTIEQLKTCIRGVPELTAQHN
ncbi:MAG: helix-turn-helix domain-containing protein [Candidatus Zixiibacteriota bacterium]|nr:MAG: helix-turn-helix domain-containing protein [candidate division Zixibacteria bacterium]